MMLAWLNNTSKRYDYDNCTSDKGIHYDSFSGILISARLHVVKYNSCTKKWRDK